jgi:SAM-dependent methyltransferase
MEDYNDRRASEYDDAFLGTGPYADRERPAGLDEEGRSLRQRISELPPCRVLDVACWTGFLTRHLRGEVVGLDLSEAMVKIARQWVPRATFVRGDDFTAKELGGGRTFFEGR